MTRSLPRLKIAAFAIMVALMVVGYANGAQAQNTQYGRQLVTGNGLFAANPSSSMTPGCSQQTANAMKGAGQFAYAQGYAAHYGLIHQPTTFFGCLQGLLNQASTLLNMFNGTGGISISGLLNHLAQAAVTNLISTLGSQVCQITNGLLSNGMSGLAGGTGGPAYNLISYMNTSSH